MDTFLFVVAIVLPGLVAASVLISVIRKDAKEQGRYSLRMVLAGIVGFCTYLIYEIFLTDKHGR